MRDLAYRNELVQLFQRLADEGGYKGVDADVVAATLSAMTSGFWLDMLTSPRAMSRDRARELCMAYLSTVYPGAFS